MSELSLIEGHVHHHRTHIAKHGFRYPTYFLQFACRAEDQLQNILRRQFKKLISFNSSDYLEGLKTPLNETITAFLLQHCSYAAANVWLFTMPRMFGYVFNPVSFWLCYKESRLDAVLVEVNNTFGEKHFYWLPPQDGLTAQDWVRADKAFHVSPFFPVEGYYKFRFQQGAEDSRIDINYFGPDDELRLATWIQGTSAPLENSSFSRLLFKYGWITPMVVLRIHYQAVFLWIKKSRFYSKPALPEKKITQ